MADGKRPTPKTTAPQRFAVPEDDFSETEMTQPGVPFRGTALPPRIATPLGGELKPAQVPRGSDAPRPTKQMTGAMVAPARAPSGPQVPTPPPGLPVPGMAPVTAAPRPQTQPPVGPRPQAAPTISAPAVPVSPPAAEPGPAPDRPAFLPAATIETPPPTLQLPQRRPLPGVAPAPPTSEPIDLIQVHVMPAGELRDPRLILARAPDSPAAACFRVLRHRVVERPGTRILLVTSPGRHEGKTTLALNLAMALGESGRARVLLLETNLRHPSLARLLGFRPPVCFGEQLEFHRTHPAQPWVVVESLSPSLHVAAVSPDAQSRPIVDGPAVATAIEQLRGSAYDHIVLDSPPVLGSADVNLLEEHVDGVIFAMWAQKSRARALRRAVEQLGRDKVLGSVLLG